jgi:hypothetical protein
MKIQLAQICTGIALLLLAGCTSPQTAKNYGFRQEVGIDSYPAEARVYIDGAFVGKTPLSAQLKANRTYEITFEKSSYKPYVEYIGPDLDMKLDPFIKIGPMESRGYYNRLGPNPLQVELEHELVPDIAGPDLLKEMLFKTEQLDKHLAEGLISIEEHRYVTRQIIEYYKDESRRRGSPILEDEEPPAAEPASIPPAPALGTTIPGAPSPLPTTPSTPATPPANINLNFADLDGISLDAPAPATTTTPPVPATTTIPDLSNIDLGSPVNNVPVESPAQPTTPAPPPPAFPAPTPGAVPGQPQPAPTPAAPPPSTGGGLLDF